MEENKKEMFEDQEVIEKTGIAVSNFKFFKKLLKKYGLVKNNSQKLTNEHVDMLMQIKEEKENSSKNWEETIVDKIKEFYPNVVKNETGESECIIKEMQNCMQEIQTKYKEIDKLKEKMIILIDKLK